MLGSTANEGATVRIHVCSGLTMILLLGLPGCDRSTGGAQAPATPADPAAAQAAAAAPGTAQEAPRTLSYASDPSVYVKGQPITPNTAFCAGGAPTSYRVSPPLPAGLALDPASGAISGTPSAVTAQRSYEVTASNGAGSTSTTLSLTVNDPAPGQAPAVTLPAFITAGAEGVAASTQDQGQGVTYEWTLGNGTLASGQGTPSITFKAGAEGTLSAQVAVRNSGGTLSGHAETTVVAAPQATLQYPAQMRAGGSASASCGSARPGLVYAWTVLPGSAGATLASGQGTPNVSLAAGPTGGSFRLQLLVQNQAGAQAAATAEIKVVPY
jgi:PKD repeat protein